MSLVRPQELPYSPISRATIQENVYGRIREMILNGDIEPGRTVTVSSLAEAFGVSAMPVREAMHRLVAEKALKVVAGRSVGIPPLSAARLEDLRRVRCEIEGMATEWAAAAITPAELRHLDELIAVMEAAKAVKDRARYVPANRDFHFTIYKAAGSPALMAIIETLWLQIGPYINLLKETENWSRANEDHKAIRDALGRGDRLAARTALQEDITEAAKALESVLKR